MGQFRITQEDGLAQKLAYLRNQWTAMKEKQILGLDKSVMYRYESPEAYISKINRYGKGEEIQTEITVDASFIPDSGNICFIIPEVVITPSSVKPTIFGGLKTVKVNSDGKVYFQTKYSLINPSSSEGFEAKFSLYSSAPGQFKVEAASL